MTQHRSPFFTIALVAAVLLLLPGCLESLTKSQEATSDASSSDPALPVNHPSPTPVNESPSGAEKAGAAFSSDLLGSRMYVRSFLGEIFSSTNPSATYALNLILDKYLGAETEDGITGSAVFDYMSLFGGPCDYYSEAGSSKACGGSPSNLNITVNVPSNASRESIRVRVCAEITANDLLIDAGLSKLALTRSNAVSDASLRGIFDLFYPGVSIDDTTLGALRDLNSAQKNNKESLINQWRMIFFTLCRTPEWQMI